MTIIGRGNTPKIAAACDNGTVGIYDSVTGVLRSSLSPPHPVQAMTGSPDGSILFCTHRENPSITMWDIQTGGLVHTFTLMTEATDTAVSLNGRYLACGFSDGTVNIWKVAKRTGGPAFRRRSAITCLCWLAPEEQLVVATGESAYIRDFATGRVLVHIPDMKSPICGVVYSQKFNLLAVIASSGAKVSIVDAQTGKSPAPCCFRQELSCFAFSQTTKVLICGAKTRGLEVLNIGPKPKWTYFNFLPMITSVSTLSNGIVVANVAGSGIQLLRLDKGYTPSQQPIPPRLSVHPLDKGRIIAVVPTDGDRVILVETATMSQVLAIPTQKNPSAPTDRTVILCASLEKKIAVNCFAEGGKAYLQLWTFFPRSPRWTAQVDEPPSAGGISPACTRLVTFHCARSRSDAHIWDVHNGGLLARLDVGWSPPPLDITFDSEDTFHVYHDTYGTKYVITTSLESGTPIHSICCLEKASPGGQAWEREYYVDDGREWVTVVGGSQRVCWIPPGYIGSDQASHCWAGSSLVMAGQDGTLRRLTFRESSL